MADEEQQEPQIPQHGSDIPASVKVGSDPTPTGDQVARNEKLKEVLDHYGVDSEEHLFIKASSDAIFLRALMTDFLAEKTGDEKSTPQQHIKQSNAPQEKNITGVLIHDNEVPRIAEAK